jgi:hypothetical protein
MFRLPPARRVSAHPCVIQALEERRLMSMTAVIKEIPISSAAKTADPALNNYKTLDLQVTVSSGDDWISGELTVNLTSGNFYSPSDGENTPQQIVWQRAEPNLEFDTFVSSPNFANPTILGSSTFSSTQVNVTWGDTTNTGAGTFTVARLTVTKSAVGTINGNVYATSAPTTAIPFASTVQSQTGSITGTVWNDLDADGVKDSGEPALSGWRIFIDKDGDKKWDTNETYVRSNSSGVYTFSGLQNGTYRICETLVDSSWRTTLPASGVYTVVLTGGSTSTKNWGNTRNRIIGTVFNDKDGDGVKDSGEPGLSGWRIFIDKDGDKKWDTNETYVRSNSDGSYAINNLANGTYKLCETLLDSSWRRTVPAGGVYTVTLSAGSQSNKLWGNTQSVSISGIVFNDANANKKKSSSESTLSSWQVFVDSDNDGVLDSNEPSAVTNSRGSYTINGASAGTHNVRIVQQSGWRRTTQSTFTVSLAAAQTISGKDFGQKRA